MDTKRPLLPNVRLATGTAFITTLVAAVWGCSSSSSSNPPSSSMDGGNSAASKDAGSSDSGSSASRAWDTGMSDSSPSTAPDDAPSSDATTPDATIADGGIAQKTSITYLFEDTADAGLVDSATVKVDPNLVNPWGLAFSPSGVAWISDNATNLATVYTPFNPGLVVPVPAASEDDGGSSNPSGQIFNPVSANFLGDKFIIATEEGTVYGWQPASDAGTPAGIRYDGLSRAAVYKGLAIVPQTAQDGSAASPILLVADLHNARIDAFDTSYHLLSPSRPSAWVNPSLPAPTTAADGAATTGYAPFNIATFTVGGTTSVYVAYGKQGADLHDAQNLPGLGLVAVFTTDGTFVKNLIPSGGVLNAPWGLELVPSPGWGSLPPGTLLVGNFGDGLVNAFDATTGAWIGSLVQPSGAPVVLPGLWALQFGRDTDAGESSQQLYFTAAPNDEGDGLFGYMTAAP